MGKGAFRWDQKAWIISFNVGVIWDRAMVFPEKGARWKGARARVGALIEAAGAAAPAKLMSVTTKSVFERHNISIINN